MFRVNTVITRGIHNNLDERVIALLWGLVQHEDDRQLDYLQVFTLTNVGTTSNKVLRIEWSQENPEHKETYYIRGLSSKISKVWIICSGEGSDEEYSTMLLPEEY